VTKKSFSENQVTAPSRQIEDDTGTQKRWKKERQADCFVMFADQQQLCRPTTFHAAPLPTIE
jgi:hypothetical protein